MFASINLKSVYETIVLKASGEVETTYRFRFADETFGQSYHDGEIRFERTFTGGQENAKIR